MLNIVREISNNVVHKLQAGKVILIFGARRVGKTFLVHNILKKIDEPALILNGEDINVHEFKWTESKSKIPSQWKAAYPDAKYKIINVNNFAAWLA